MDVDAKTLPPGDNSILGNPRGGGVNQQIVAAATPLGYSLPQQHQQQPQFPLSQPQESSPLSPDRRPKKSPTTCTTCRARKVRCNGSRPNCSNCERLGFPCSYDDNDNSAWTMSLPRRRVKQACANCHSRKARCSGHLPMCERCRAQGLECVYRPNKRVKTSISMRAPGSGISPQSHDDDRDDMQDDSEPSLTDRRSNTPTTYYHDIPNGEESFDSLIGKTFELFFRNVHHIPMYSFLHRASLSEQYHAGKADKALLLALVGITACLTDMGPGMREYGDRCINDAERLIFADYTRPSTIKVQALVFMIKHRVLNNRFPSAFMLLSIASRYAVALRLNHESPNICFLAQESRRRLLWTLYCIDSSLSGGSKDFSLWTADQISIGLPCNERNFEFDLPQVTEKLEPDPDYAKQHQGEDIGSLALHIRILYIRQQVIEFNKSVLTSRNVNTGDLQTRVLELHKELEDFAANLPTSFQFSDSSLRLRAYSPRICVFVMIHIWWRQCHCDLYRLALVGLREALPRSVLDNFDDSFIQHCQRQCVDHSLEMASIFSAIQKLNAKFVADLDLGICAYQCARMLTYAYHTNSVRFDLTADAVLEKANVCLQAIKKYCMGSAATGIRSDLEKLITQGLSARNTPSRVAPAEGGGRKRKANPNHSLARHAMLKDMDIDSAAAANASGGNPTNPRNDAIFPSASASGMTQSSLPPSIMTDPWATEGQTSQDVTGSMPEVQVVTSRKPNPTPDITPRSDLMGASELNNAYEGAIDGMSLDNGLDYALGLDLNMWVPTGDWLSTELPVGGGGSG